MSFNTFAYKVIEGLLTGTVVLFGVLVYSFATEVKKRLRAPTTESRSVITAEGITIALVVCAFAWAGMEYRDAQIDRKAELRASPRHFRRTRSRKFGGDGCQSNFLYARSNP